MINRRPGESERAAQLMEKYCNSIFCFQDCEGCPFDYEDEEKRKVFLQEVRRVSMLSWSNTVRFAKRTPSKKEIK